MSPIIADNKMNNVNLRRVKFGQLLEEELLDETSNRFSNASEILSSTTTSSSNASPRLSSFGNVDENYSTSNTASPYYYNNNMNNNNNIMSPWSQASSSPYLKSPWIKLSPYPHPTVNNHGNNNNSANNIYFSRGKNCLVGSLLREEGHVYSLAAKEGMLYTGSESKNIRVWSEFQDAGGFKSGSGLVKAIVISKVDNRVFTGHQDGKIRVWSAKGKRVGTLPKFGDYLVSSMNPKNYIEVRRHHKVPRIKHFDAVSCMSLNEDAGLLYSGSWDKTIKVWRVSDGKCLESIVAHDDAINSIVVGFDGLVFSGSADGTVKVWRRELDGKRTKHFHVTTLLTQENAVTALAVAVDPVAEEEDGDDNESSCSGGGVGGGGFVLYAASSDGLVNFWEREKEELCYGGVLRGHKSAVLCLATAGGLVFSGSADKTICVWKREEGGGGVHSCLAVLSGHSGPVKCLAVELDREYDEEEEEERQWVVYSGSLDKSVKIWRVSEHAPDDELTY